MKELVGSAAALITTIAFLPQVFKIYHTSNTESLSLGTTILFLTGVSLWFLYGILLNEPPIYISNFIIVTCQIYILYKILSIKFFKEKFNKGQITYLR